MSCIHYKFKTSLDYRSISFDGVALSLADLKKSIFQQKRMKTGEFDLEITNAQTKEVYKNNDDMIPKNSSVIVARVPIPTSTKNSTSKSWEAFKQECARAIKEEQEKAAQEAATQAAGDLTNAKFSEIDKIKAMMNQATRDFDPLNYKNKVPLGPPPANYRCYKCGKGGHYIQSCTVEKSEGNMLEPNRFKRSTGIPNSFLTLTNDPTAQGALLTYSGKFAVPTIDAQAYLTGKKERPPFLPGNNDESAVTPLTKIIPQELLCLVCKDLLRDAVLIPCCGNSFCDECIRNRLLETEDHECPFCHEQDVSPDKLIANMQMRRAITNFLNETGYSQVKNRNIEHLKEERRSSSPTEPPKIMQSATQPPLQRHQPAQPQTPLTTRDAWRQYNQRKHPASSSVSAQSIQTVPHSQTPPQQAHQSHELQHMQPLHPQQMHPTHHQGHPALQQPQTVPQHVHAPHSVHLPPQGHAGYQPVHEAPQSVHPIPQSVHPVPQSVHPIPQSVHPVPQSVHPVPQSLHQVPQSRHPIPQSVHPIPQSVHPIPQSLHPIPQSVHPAPHHIQPTIQQVHVPPHAVNHPLHTAMESQHVPTQLPQQIIPRTEHVTYASPGHLNQVPSVNTSSFSQQLENRSPEERAPTPVKDEQPLPPGVDDHMGSVISVVGQPSSDALRGGQPPSSGNVPSWKGNTNPPSSVIPAFTSVPPGIGISHPQPLFGHPPGYPVPVVGTPIYGPPFVPGGTVPPFAPGGPASLPMSKEEFYREQKRMKEFVMEKKYDVMDHFTKDFLERKERVKPKSKTRSRSRSLSKSSRRTRSPRRSISRTPRRSLTPIRKRTRSRSPYRSRSRSRTSRLRTRSRSRSRFRSRSRSRYRSRSRSFIRSSSRGRYRSFSRSPLRRRYSRSRSRSSFRRYSPTRRRSPLGSRRKSYSPSGSPGYRGRYERRWSPRHGERYNSPDRFTPSSAPTFPDYGFNRPSAPNDFYRFDGHGPPPPGSNPEYFGNQGRYVPPLVPPPPLLPGVPVGPPTGYQGFQGPPPPSILPGQSRSPKHISRPRDASPHGRYGYSRRYDRKDKYDRTNPSSDRYLDKSKYSRDDRDGHGRKDSIRTQDKDVSHDKDRNQMSDSGKSKSTRDKKHKDNRENGKNDDGSEKIDGRSKRKKESKKRDKSEKKKRDKSKDKKKTETETSKENADSEGKEHKQKIDADTTKVPLSVGNTFTRNANSTLIFLTGGGEETSAAKETSKTITQSTPSTPQGGDISKTDRILKADKATDVTESKKVKKVRKKVKENPDDTSDSNTEKNKSKTKSRKKTLVEYNETSGDTSDKLSKRKISKKAKKDKTKSSNEDAQIEESKVSKVEKKGEKDDMKENMTDSSMKTELIDTETNLVNRAPPSPHDVVPSSPMDTTDGIHEDEPSPPGVGTDKSEVLQEKTDLSDDKPQLMFDLPELSKWERDDFDDEGPEQMEPQKTEIKKSLPKSVIEKAEKALTQKIPKISSIASAITSPPQIQLKKRRVYLDDEKPSEKKTVEQSEDDRRVHTKQKSMQITISSKEKQRSEENEKRERQNEKSRSGNRRDRVDSEEKREREPERKSVFSRMKMDDSDQNRDKKSREDSSSQNIRDLREKLPSRTDRRDHDKYDKDRERHESRERYDKDRQRQDKDYDRKDHPRQEKESSYKHKESSNKNDTQRSMDSRELSELRENRKPKFDKDLRKPDRGDSKDKGSSERKISASEEKPDKKSKPVIDRKESILDESLFEPDYNEDLSESDSSSIEPSTTKDKEASLSFSSRDNSTSPKKRKRQDTTDDENQSKKSKHKKHKHKSGKHKHKKKKHRKSKDEVEK